MKVFNVVIAFLLGVCFVRAVFGVEPISLHTLLTELNSIDFGIDKVVLAFDELRYFSWDITLNHWYEFYKYIERAFDFFTGCISVIGETLIVLVDMILSILYFLVRLLGLPDIPLTPNA